MRELTLDEKISLKGKFALRKFCAPELKMIDALYYWSYVFGYKVGINRWYNISR